MIDVLKTILRSINLEDLRISKLHDYLGNGLTIPTNDWIISFEYTVFRIVIELNNMGSKDPWALLSRYSLYDGELLDLHREELADITPQTLHKTITDFINKEE